MSTDNSLLELERLIEMVYVFPLKDEGSQSSKECIVESGQGLSAVIPGCVPSRTLSVLN